MEFTRRAFLATSTLAAGAASASRTIAAPPPEGLSSTDPGKKKGEMLYRALGRTGETVSLIGLGGFHIGMQKEEAESVKLIRTAIDRGITFMDNCWDYHLGGSELRMGKALQDGYRDKVFLMTKIDGRTRKAAEKQIDESLLRLRTDRLDLVQHHEIIRFEDPDQIFKEGGAQEAVLAAQKAGKLRFIGFTGHKNPAIHLQMLDTAAEHGFRFDTVQMPLNIMDAHFRSFEQLVLPRLVKEEIGVLGMKALGDPFVLNSKAADVFECLHYPMSLPISVQISGIDSLKVLDQAFEAVRTFKPPTREQRAALLARTREMAMSGRYEPFKTSAHFDGTAEHPEWLGYPKKEEA